MALSKELLDILACPKCKGPLSPTGDQSGLVCPKCCVEYPVKDDIPILIIDQASPLPPKQDA